MNLQNQQNISGFTALLGVSIAICTIGLILTITIIFAFIGLPLLMIGAVLFILTIGIKILLLFINLFRQNKMK
ncbi:MAG: hypothetical protein ACD_51C00361G0006 [uncultured bacterium]|nr:MAG: hypothetical protein ACD_51C00361G0006 [uncultured bacterium]OGH14220.1 MAG: hypothetical protein A2687_05855 [Candidatus Levybacteria bacterium RIFCSPHIGHO2_01_FULL_38_26]